MLIPRGGGRGTRLLDRLGLLGLMGLMGLMGRMGPGIGAFLDTAPGDVARGAMRPKRSNGPMRFARRRPLAPGRKVAITLRSGLRAIPLARFRQPSTAGISAHG